MATSFRPLTGMVLVDHYISYRVKEFSPPYGDGTKRKCTIGGTNMFSPPYGDGTGIVMTSIRLFKFSPPYGDGTEMNAAEKASF